MNENEIFKGVEVQKSQFGKGIKRRKIKFEGLLSTTASISKRNTVRTFCQTEDDELITQESKNKTNANKLC